MSTEELPDHAENSPSSAEGWATCEDYINANRGLKDTTSYAAAEGTAAHWIRNECLMNGEDAVNYVGYMQKVGEWTFEWTDEDAFLLQPGIDHIRAYTGTLYGEHWVDLTEWLGLDTQGRRQGGTLDTAIDDRGDTLMISDLKWGRGIAVRPRENKQSMLYALGAWAEHGRRHTRFILEIDQPRHMGGGGSWETDLATLLKFGAWIKERAAATRSPNTTRTASWKGCLWCHQGGNWAVGNPKCATYDQFVMDALLLELDDLDVKMPETLTPEQRRVIVENRSSIDIWLDGLKDGAMDDALHGRPTAGLKAVHGRRKNTVWKDEVAAKGVVARLLGDDGFTKKLITPLQACRAITSDSFDHLLLEPLIQRGDPTVVLAPEDDERPAITSAAEFDDLPE